MVAVEGSGVAWPVPRWQQWTAEVWWLTRFLAALAWLTARGLVRMLGRVPPPAWPPLGCVALCAYFAFRAVSAWLADPRPLGVILTPVALALGGFIALWITAAFTPTVVAGRGRTRTTIRTTITGQTEVVAHFAPPPTGKRRGQWFTCRHEAGHAAAAVHVGGTVTKAVVHADGSGYCGARLPREGSQFKRVVNYVALLAGGECAVHSRSGCSHDQANITRALDTLPEHQRAQARNAGYASAHAAQHAQSAFAKKVASALAKTGTYHGSGGSEHYGV